MVPQDWDGRDRVLRKERKREEQWWTGGGEKVVLMVGEVDVIVSQLGKFSLDATGPPLPAEPTSSRCQTGRRGLNQTPATEHDLASSAGKEGRADSV